MAESLEYFAKSGVLPQVCSETGAESEPVSDVIICDTISGGARYDHDMPRGLILTRRTINGDQYRRRYIQDTTQFVDPVVAT